MAKHKLVFIPDQRLRLPTKAIEKVDDKIKTLIDDMFETMYAANGVGLAAPQIGISLKLAVIDATRDKSQQLVLINPEVLELRDMITMEEGCLSVPGAYETVERAKWVKMRALDRNGKEYELEAEDLLAEAIQHEIDHLNGKLYFDTLSPLKRNRVKKKVDKYKKWLAKQDG